MVDFHDRRLEDRDFADGKGGFTLTTAGDAQHEAWSGREVDRSARRDVHGYYRGQKDTATWSEANRLAARRTQRSGRSLPFKDAADYAGWYEQNLARVMAHRGLDIARKHGEIQPGRG